MKRKIRYAIIILPLVLNSCTYTMYVPNMTNVPMFERKGQLTSTVTLSDLQFAYAATKNIGFTLNGFYRPRKIFHLHNGKEDDFRNNNQGLDMAFTYYKVSPKSINEFLVGYGQGSTAFSYTRSGAPDSQYGGSSDFRKYYFQYDLVLIARKETKWAITTRLDLVTLFDFKDVHETPMPNCTSTIFTPGLSWRKKYEGASLLLQVQFPLPSEVDKDKLSNYHWGTYPPFQERVMFNLGVAIHILDPRSKAD